MLIYIPTFGAQYPRVDHRFLLEIAARQGIQKNNIVVLFILARQLSGRYIPIKSTSCWVLTKWYPHYNSTIIKSVVVKYEFGNFFSDGLQPPTSCFSKAIGNVANQNQNLDRTQQRFGISLGYSMLQLLNMGMRQTKMRQRHWQIDHGHSGHAIEVQCRAVTGANIWVVWQTHLFMWRFEIKYT